MRYFLYLLIIFHAFSKGFKKMKLLKFSINLLFCIGLIVLLPSVSKADNLIDFNEGRGVGVGQDTFQINNVKINATIPDASSSTGTRIIPVYYDITFRFDASTLQLVPIISTLREQSRNCSIVELSVLNQENNQPISGVNVTIDQMTLVTDAKGFVRFTDVSSGWVILNLSKDGFLANTQSLNLSCTKVNAVEMRLQARTTTPDNTTTPNSNNNSNNNSSGSSSTTAIPSPDNIPKQSMVMSLDWGDNPRDLDLHVTGPSPNTPSTYKNKENRFHVYFSNTKSPDSSVVLNVDLFSAIKPEVTNINLPSGRSLLNAGVYRVSVQHFAGNGSIANANAKVTLKIGDGVEQTFIPVPNAGGLEGKTGDLWVVCEITVDDNGRMNVTPINQYRSNINPSDVE